MSRNLLSRLRQAPNPANVPPARVADWTEIADPSALAHLDFGPPTDHVRQRVQSIPSPWARMLLFRNALEEDGHPARSLVQSELLDAFELLWSLPSYSAVNPIFKTVRIASIEQLARSTASQRVDRFARALVELIPRKSGDRIDPAFESIDLLIVEGRPILATSPFTGVFTAEDAASTRTGPLFRYAEGRAYRSLSERSPDFQRYVARVLLPQLSDAGSAGADTVRLLRSWLRDEVRASQDGSPTPNELAIPDNWENAANQLGLHEISDLRAFPRFYSREAGAEVQQSRWRLQSSRASKMAPLVIERGAFDGTYWAGAASITLPGSLSALDRNVLPVTGVTYPWVNPAEDWFADKVLVLQEPVVTGNVHGFQNFHFSFQGDRPYLKAPHFTLPLRREILEYFSAEELSNILSIETRPDGRIVASLKLSVGDAAAPRELTVSRTYDDTAIEVADGPSLTLWPRFKSDEWRAYILLRDDANAANAQMLNVSAVAAGKTLSGGSQQRTATSKVYSFDSPPEAFEFLAPLGPKGAKRFGLLVPRYTKPQGKVAGELKVGVDFGTSNTVVSLRSSAAPTAEIFGVEELTLPLTHRSADAERRADAYFLPHSLDRTPFGTAIMRFNALPALNIITEPLGIRVNIPFSGVVDSDTENRVVGDLKWSSEKEGLFLSAAFIRHLLVVIAAEGEQRGFRSSDLNIVWSHPRAFTPSQVNQLRNLWDQAKQSLESFGIRIGNVGEAVDESRAVLRHFFNAGLLGVAGSANAIIDVGGGTSDIAVYGRGKTILLDSVMLGGRNLTGARMQGATETQTANPFVRSFITWSGTRQLSDYPVEKRAVDKYCTDGQDHLAFSYLLQTKWFDQQGRHFSGDDSAHEFQKLVLYFFGALCYYLGLALRSTGEVPSRVMLAGNGSQYLDWLTDLQHRGHGPFTEALGKMVLAGLGDPPGATPPRIELTTTPKREVAYGLVSAVNASLDEAGALQESVVGESLTIPVGAQTTQLDAADRLPRQTLFQPADAARISWAGGEMEITRFHAALLREAKQFPSFGAHWQATSRSLGQFFEGMTPTRIQDLTRDRLLYVAEKHGGFQGSMFILEVSAVLDQMLAQSFA